MDGAYHTGTARWVARRLLAVGLVAIALAACQPQVRAPIEQKTPASAPAPAPRAAPAPAATPAVRPQTHIVVRGDTLHAIAWRYGVDFREIVRWNRLENPDRIYVGQRLQLQPPPTTVTTRPVAPPPRPAARPLPPPNVTAAPPVAAAAPRPAPSSPPAQPAPAASGSGRWVWPATGKVTAARSVSGTRGIEIRGVRGQDVLAASAGTVVYSGSGLRGYGELIIVKHDETFLSAYAHNEARLVEEGQTVKGGQVIAKMGDTEARDVMLHFEIRRNGKSVDPQQYLPKR